MGTTYVPEAVGSGVQTTSTLNDNFTNIQTALAASLSRNGTSPNGMNADIDMNSNDILNIASLNTTSLIVGGTAVTATADLVQTQFVENVVALAASSFVAGTIVETKGYTSSGDSGNARYLVKTAAEFGGTPDEKSSHTMSNGNVAVLQPVGGISLKQTGAIGDGVVDDTASVIAALTLFPGEFIFGVSGENYKVIGEVLMTTGVIFDGRDSTMTFTPLSLKQCLAMNDDTTLKNITILVDIIQTGGDGWYQVPINIGDIRGVTGTGTKNVKIQNVKTRQVNVNRANIGIWADSHNIEIDEVEILSTTLGGGLGILAHWGAEDDLLINGTNHPYNITINNVKAESVRPTIQPSESGIVFLSGCLNIDVSNVLTRDAWQTIRVQPGSPGSDSCLTWQEEFIITGITCTNIQSHDVEQPLSVTWGGNAGVPQFEHEAQVEFINCKNINPVAQLTNSAAFVFSATGRILVKGGETRNYFNGIVSSTFGGVGGVTGTTIEDHTFESIGHSGIIFDNTASDFTSNNNVIRCRFFDINTIDDTTAPRLASAVYSDGERTTVRDIRVGRTTSELAIYGVYFDTNARDCYAEQINVIGIKPTGTAVFSNSTDNRVRDIINKTTGTDLNGTDRENKAAFSATLGGVNQSIPNSASTLLQFDTTSINEDTTFDTTNFRHVPNIPGVYAYTLTHVLRAISSQTLIRGELFKNGVSVNNTEHNTHDPSTSTSVGGTGTLLIPMNGTTDFVDARLFHTNGVAKDADGANKFGCVFSGRLI